MQDMERWAKVQNMQNESAASPSAAGFKKPLAPISAVVKSKESAAADAGSAVLSKVEHYRFSVLFFSRPRSKGWQHHGRTFSIYPCPPLF